MPVIEQEIPVDDEIKSYDELVVGLPKDNLTIVGLARKLAQGITRPPTVPFSDARAKLKSLVRYKPASLEHAWALTNTKNKGLETRSYQFLFTNGLSAAGVWAKAIISSNDAPATIVLNDKGKKAAAGLVVDRLNRGEQVLAVDLLFTGDAAPNQDDFEEFPLMLATTGDRALGIEAAQLIALAVDEKASAARKSRLKAPAFVTRWRRSPPLAWNRLCFLSCDTRWHAQLAAPPGCASEIRSCP